MKNKIVLFAVLWLILLAIGVSAWKFLVSPAMQENADQEAAKERGALVDSTAGSSRYDMTINVGMDAFSGYAVLRSDAFRDALAKERIRLNVVDDGANYENRIGGLQDGGLQFAAFPADALISVSESLDYLPATIVAVIDETAGADAIVANRRSFAGIDEMNRADVRFVLVGDSPSETLARVVMTNFELSNLGSDPFLKVESPEAVVRRYKNSKSATPEVYVTWEPFVSQITNNDQMHVLIDSSEFTGYILDTLVVSRDFLSKKGPVVDQVLRAYFRALYQYRTDNALEALIASDAKRQGNVLTDAQVKKLISGIRWRTTQDNFTHFGLKNGELQHIEDMLLKITQVLSSTGAIGSDPTDGDATKLFYDSSMKKLLDSNFYPDVDDNKSAETRSLRKLSENQWANLRPVGTVRLETLRFARGGASLSRRSQRVLKELAEKAKSWPRYYLAIQGNAFQRGNARANAALAARRANAALEYLLKQGVSADRMRVEEGKTSGGSTSVTFVVKELPY